MMSSYLANYRTMSSQGLLKSFGSCFVTLTFLLSRGEIIYKDSHLRGKHLTRDSGDQQPFTTTQARPALL